MVKQISIEEMAVAMRPDTLLRGQFMAQLFYGDWVGMDSTGSEPQYCRGSFRDVIEKFVPPNGNNIIIGEDQQGVRVYDGVMERITMVPYTKRRTTTRGSWYERKFNKTYK